MSSYFISWVFHICGSKGSQYDVLQKKFAVQRNCWNLDLEPIYFIHIHYTKKRHRRLKGSPQRTYQCLLSAVVVTR